MHFSAHIVSCSCWRSVLCLCLSDKSSGENNRSALFSGCLAFVTYTCKVSLSPSCSLGIRDILLDRVMYVVFLPLQSPAPVHRDVLWGCSADLWPQRETALPFMSPEDAINQVSAASFDLWQHVSWGYASEVDFGVILADMAHVNFNVGVC